MKICIYSYSIYELFINKDKGMGGAELQLLQLGTLLHKQGYDVTFLIGEASFEGMNTQVDGFSFIKLYPNIHFSLTRKFFHLAATLWNCEAAVLIERGASTTTFWLSVFARLKGSRYIFCAASDIDFATDELHPSFTSKIQQWLFHLGLQMASNVVVQKETQRSLLQKNFRRHSTVIKNFPPITHAEENAEKEWDVIWVNNIIPYKKPETVIALAEKLAPVKFLMIGGSRNSVYFEEIKREASLLANITFLGFVPFNEVGRYIARSKIMINTTIVKGKYEEGFPNSFLQAWQAGIPVLSLISNPDGILEKYQIGICSQSIEKMETDLTMLLGNQNLRREMGQNALHYLANFHNRSMIVKKYKDVIES